MKKLFRNIAIVIVTVGIVVVGLRILHAKTGTVLAVGDLTVDFHVPLNNPIFSITNTAPGDPAVTRNVDVTNGGTTSELVSVKGVRTGGVGNNPQLESALDIVISVNGTPLYGTGSNTGPRTVAQFFSDSNASDGVKLNTINAGGHKTYVFSVTFPSSAGNEYQAKSVIFNLTFGEVSSDHVLINEVYYQVDPQHGMDSPKDRGVMSVNGNKVTINISGNGAGSKNTVTVNQAQACQILQSNNTTSSTSVTSTSNSGKNAANFNTSSTSTITTGSSTSITSIKVNGGSNTSTLNCGAMLGQNDEWVELYNPTDHDINLKNWYFMDNSGIVTKINAVRIIKAGGYALVSKDASTWKYWSENPTALKIPLGSNIGDGLDNAGDHVILFSNTGAEQDRMSWGTDTSGFTPAGSLPIVPLGSSNERVTPSVDTDTISDWKVSTPPTP